MDEIVGSHSYLIKAQLKHKSVRHKLDVRLHQIAVHAYQFHGQGFGKELLTKGQTQNDEKPLRLMQIFVFFQNRLRPAFPQTCSISTAFLIMLLTVSSEGLFNRCLNMRHAKSQCRPWRKINELIRWTIMFAKGVSLLYMPAEKHWVLLRFKSK